jgi:nucleoside-diphosphate-sugar epimerase
MRIFLTGATGFIGSAVIPELIGAGHTVLGLTRSDAGAEQLKGLGAEVHRGSLEDLESLKRGAEDSEGVIHCAFDHDFSNFVANTEKDRRVIEAMGSVLVGSKRPLVITSGTGMGSKGPGDVATEDYFDPKHMNPRKASEEAGNALLEKGVNVSVVRLPQVHDTEKQGLITPYVMMAREKGKVAYVGDGLNRFPAVHRFAAAKVYQLAFDKAEAGSRYHAVAEEGVPVRAMAEVIGRGLKLPVVSLTPEEAMGHFGWLGPFMGYDMPASSKLTQERLGWKPEGPGILEDLEAMKY